MLKQLSHPNAPSTALVFTGLLLEGPEISVTIPYINYDVNIPILSIMPFLKAHQNEQNYE